MEILDQKRSGRTIRMYSAEQRAKAIETFARFGCSAADTIAELGYPNRATLRSWWKEYQLSGDEFLERRHRRPRYSDEERRGAVYYYLEHGKSLARTIRAVGYPSRGVLASWASSSRRTSANTVGAIPGRAFCRSRRRCGPWRSSRPGAAAPPRSPAGTACPAARLTPGGGRSWA